jgi:cellulose synthase (UDP-forming)
MALINPRLGKFNVTAKGGLVEHEFFDWRISAPYLALVLLNVVGALLAIPRMIWWNSFEADTVAINLIWTLFNLTLLGAVLGVAAETRQIRTAPRVPKRMPASIYLAEGDAPIYCKTVDFSMHGLGVATEEPLAVSRGQLLRVSLFSDNRECMFPSEVAVVKDRHIGLLLKELSIEQEQDYVRCTFGSPDVWSDWDRNVGVDHPLASFAEVFSYGATGYVRLFESIYSRLLPMFQRRPRHTQGVYVE